MKANEHGKDAQHWVTRKMPIKSTMRYDYRPIRMSKMKKNEDIKCW